MNSLEKSRSKLVHFCFPFIERFYLLLYFALLVAAWSIPEAYWQIRVAFFGLWFIVIEIHSEGIMERDYFPIQPGNSLFYHIYRFINRVFFLFLLLLLIILLLPVLPWLKVTFMGVIVIAVILQAIGNHKYRPKKPEE